MAYRPQQQKQASDESTLFVSLAALAEDDGPIQPSRTHRVGDVVVVPCNSLDRGSVLRGTPAENLSINVWLRGGRLFVAADEAVLTALKAITLAETGPTPEGTLDCLSPPTARQEINREKAWWISAGPKESGHWLVRMGEQKKKLYVKKDKSETIAEYDMQKAELRLHAMACYDLLSA